MVNIFHLVLVQPIFNLLVFLYNVIPGSDIGFAIILLTILIKLLLWPFMNVSLKSQKALQDIQPKIEDLKVKHKDDKEGLAKAMMALYQTEKVSPFSSCLPLLIQFPILIALYEVLLQGFKPEALNQLYSFVPNPGVINNIFLGFMDLAVPSIALAVIAGIFQFFQTKMLMSKQPPKQVSKTPGAKDESMLASMNKSMLYFMPVMTVIIGINLPGGLALYWVTVTIVSIIQQVIVFKKKPDSAGDAQKLVAK
ncbi:MAG: YidC/Oxa1 family membrane protein insertase [Patescibacteria group bacterium]